MQIKLKKDCTYLTNKLEGLHVSDVKELKGINTLGYTVKLDSDDETDLCSSDGLFLRDNMVLDKDCNPIQTAIVHDFRFASYVSDTFKIYLHYDSVLDNTNNHNFLSSATVYSKAMNIEKKHNRLLNVLIM